MNVKRGDVIYLFKETPCPNAKRPFVIVSNDVGNHYSEICLGVPLTTKYKKDYPTHCRIGYNNSIVMTEQICTINKGDIERVLTSLNEVDMMKINDCLNISLALKGGYDHVFVL